MALQPRPPIITIMGHVDHGKTSLLDFIRTTKVAAGEAGGITQHIGAYQIVNKGKKLTFIDTPGHAAFTKMRERGAKVTDIVVLVVAVNDGVKPQTIESIRHIKEAGVAVVVAINKSDLPDTYPDMVKAQLAEQGILVNGFGGSIDAIQLSAKTGQGVDQLLDTLQVMSELMELQADPEAPLKATVIEAAKDPRRGSVSTVIVQQGTLKVRQDVFADEVIGRVRQLSNELGMQLQEVLPGDPVEIVGLEGVPAVGSVIQDQAADYTQAEGESEAEATPTTNIFVPTDFAHLLDEKVKLKIILKADVEGTLEAIRMTLDEESVDLIQSDIGPVLERDIELAEATGAAVISFHTKVSKKVKEQAKQQGVKLKSYDVIYELIEDLQKQMLKLMEPTIDEVVIGEAEILQLFEMKGDHIAGIKVKTGEIRRIDLMHLKRDDKIIANPVIKSMMHGKEEIQSLKAKNEGGMTFKNRKLDFKVGDILIAYKIVDEE